MKKKVKEDNTKKLDEFIGKYKDIISKDGTLDYKVLFVKFRASIYELVNYNQFQNPADHELVKAHLSRIDSVTEEYFTLSNTEEFKDVFFERDVDKIKDKFKKSVVMQHRILVLPVKTHGGIDEGVVVIANPRMMRDRNIDGESWKDLLDTRDEDKFDVRDGDRILYDYKAELKLKGTYLHVVNVGNIIMKL